MRTWQQLKNIYHFGQATFWRAWYRYPDKDLTLYGITGTNGKTTTCYILTSILKSAYSEAKVGMLTTVAFEIAGRQTINETKMTTLPSRTLFSYLAHMQRAGVTHAVLEVTSHALDQHRLAGLKLAGAIILNVTREHLDYHGTMPAYAAAKERIVAYLKPQAPLVGKGDDAWVQPMVARAVAQGFPTHEFTSQPAADVVTPLIGAINKENAWAALLLARAVGVPEAAIQQGIAHVKSVPGRMEWLKLPSGGDAVIDYAVTPDALKRLYQEVRSRTQGNIIGVLGACGRRDRGKRPLMSQTVAELADELILTREDPWDEPEEQIFSDLEQGLQQTATPWQRITDRKDALRYALNKLGPGDTVVVTGKGAERGMAIGSTIVPWNERAVILELAQPNQSHL